MDIRGLGNNPNDQGTIAWGRNDRLTLNTRCTRKVILHLHLIRVIIVLILIIVIFIVIVIVIVIILTLIPQLQEQKSLHQQHSNGLSVLTSILVWKLSFAVLLDSSCSWGQQGSAWKMHPRFFAAHSSCGPESSASALSAAISTRRPHSYVLCAAVILKLDSTSKHH